MHRPLTHGRTPLLVGFALVASGVVVLGASSTAVAALPQQAGSVNLLTQSNVVINGAALADSSGYAVDGAGDVNGDGIDDVIVGAPGADSSSASNAGVSSVIFGSAAPTTVALAGLGAGGFAITGAAANDQAGGAVAAAGDVNGDGLDDVIVGAPGAAPSSRANAGRAYVVFGSASSAPVNLASPGPRGFAIDGAADYDSCGYAAAGAGDVNGDGRDDVIVGCHGADPLSRANAGASYVVFGSSSTATVDLASLGSAGFVINGAVSNDLSGYSVDAAGDVNGDHRADVIVGAPAADPSSRVDAGTGYVVYGSASPTAIDLATLGAAGFAIEGGAAADNTAVSVAGAGDINGDGREDVIVGAPFASPVTRIGAGASYVVFGSASPITVDVATLGSAGFAITGQAAGDASGWWVNAAGDTNGDGRDDVVVGAPYASPSSLTSAGSAAVVYGSASPATVDLASLGIAGIGMAGGAANNGAGYAVAGAGDFNADGRDDVLVGEPYAATALGSNMGVTDLIYGFGNPSVSYPGLINGTVGTAVASLTPTIARTGSPSFSVSPALSPGLTLSPTTGVISGTPTQTSAPTTYTVTMTDLSGQASTSVVVTVADVPTTPAAPATASGSLRVRSVRQGPRGVMTTGTVSAGVTRVVQVATSIGTRSTQRQSRKREAARTTTRCTISGTGRARTFTCTARLAPGTWMLTTQAKAGSVVVAQTMKRVRVVARPPLVVPVTG